MFVDEDALPRVLELTSSINNSIASMPICEANDDGARRVVRASAHPVCGRNILWFDRDVQITVKKSQDRAFNRTVGFKQFTIVSICPLGSSFRVGLFGKASDDDIVDSLIRLNVV